MSTTPDKQAFWPDEELAIEAAREPPRRPVCGLAIAFCCGITLGLEFPIAIGALLLAGGVCALAALWWRRQAGADFLLAAGLVCVGWAHASLAAHSPSGREVVALLERPAEYVAVIGEVRDWEFGSPPCGWILAIDVRPDARLLGAATQLLQVLCQGFKRAKVSKVRTLLARENTLILSFFRSQGMMISPFIPLEMDLAP